MAKSAADPRQCFYISPVQQVSEHGYIPSLVTENEPGHAMMIGKGEGSTPWFWGKTLERAEQVCDRVNKQRYGISPKTALRIVASSMRASNV